MPLAYKALFLDLSGVIYEGNQTIPGAVEAVVRAREKGLALRFITNTASQSSRDLLRRLRSMGLSLQDSELFTAPLAAKAYILEHRLRPLCIVNDAVQEDLADLDSDDPNCVLLGDARDGLNYRNLNRAFRLCRNGAPLIGIGMNKYFKDDEGLMLDAGPFIRALEWAADVTAVIMGKPSQAFFDQVRATTGLSPEQCLMVGDDVAGDVEGAVKAGLQGCLVRTGKFLPEDEQRLPAGAQVVDSLADLFY
ncbi:predicted sugar phosphatase of the HAD superfamily [Hahella chejuensis KCTC 2396]|uniref:Haloacid dehalogenase-like hydrolase domain-containing protein 2 n=1 Tax=Hahella chejuensis (strain KCTC 2396) TaxID=349521 RepID=Q2SEW2_HAHCH|nr:TIGR01458 family HAD-type hydrolase [Hahella chejuensis]ABC30812.1 predicted sugar phosphatase of the HAD superfamily [Hahella chejuensis KCTC 2396]